jgi:hypothetical protein
MNRVSRLLPALFAASTVLLSFAPAHAQKPDPKIKTMPGTSTPKGAAPTVRMTGASKTPTIKTTKKTPPRDPKTGRFIKADAVGKSTTMKITTTTPKTVKSTPARDPKTGRFISTKPKTGTAPTPTP